MVPAMTQPARPADMVELPIPDMTLTANDGRPYPLRQRVGQGPQVLFFYIRNGTPG